MESVTAHRLTAMVHSGGACLLVDTRARESYREGHIPGARNIPVDRPDFVAAIADLVSRRDERIVLYGASAACGRSRRAADKLEKARFSTILIFEGGLREWMEQHHDVTTVTAGS